jgi:hypothetical protein
MRASVPILIIAGAAGVREQSPSAATAHHVEDCVQDLAERVQPRSANCLGRREERVQASEFSVSEVGQVRSPWGQTPAILPGKPTCFPVFRQFLAQVPLPTPSESPLVRRFRGGGGGGLASSW